MAIGAFHTLFRSMRVAIEDNLSGITACKLNGFPRSDSHGTADERQSDKYTYDHSCDFHYFSPPFINKFRYLNKVYQILYQQIFSPVQAFFSKGFPKTGIIFI
jgi:hypothetical protein